MKKLLLLSLLLATLSSCGGLPAKPKVDFCTLHIEELIAVCVPNHGLGESYEKPLAEFGAAIMFSGDDWVKITAYIAELKRALKKKLGRKKFNRIIRKSPI